MNHQANLEKAIAEFPGSIGLVIQTHDALKFDHNGEQPWDPASVIKLIILLAVHKYLDMDETVRFPPVAKGGGWGVLQFLSRDLHISIRDIATLMIIVSDNVASDYLLSRLSPQQINTIIADLNLRHTTLASGFGTSMQPVTFADHYATTPDDILLVLQAVSAVPSFMEILAAQQDKSILRRFLPPDVTCCSKSGEGTDVRNDCGILTWPDGSACIVLFSRIPQPIANLRRLTELDLQLAHVAEAAYLWARNAT